ncbi:MAG: FtsW/RodA/SpoVE family cell cycle protein [Opitutales bacterium]
MILGNYSEFKQRDKKLKFDYLGFFALIALFILGAFFIYSAQSYNIEEIALHRQFWFKQLVFAVIGLIAYFIIALNDYEILMRFANIIYIGAILLLLPLAIQENLGINIPFVQSRFNATRWMNFGFISLQPSEIAKIATLIMSASILARSKLGKIKDSMRSLSLVAGIYSFPVILIFLQPDLGSTLVFPPMLFSMLFISRLSKRFFVLCIAIFCILMALVSADIYGYSKYLENNNLSAAKSASLNAYGQSKAILPMKDYQRNRILSFVAPEIVDPRGQGISWNYRQSLIAVGSGGLLGKGHTQGTQAKLGYLPSDVAYNDFIFSVIAEEIGFVGTSLSLLLLSIVIFSCVRTAILARDSFGAYMAIAIASVLMTHIFINVGMTIGIMPITGLPLPMLSYGGTFVLTCCILLGIVQSIYRHGSSYKI